MPVIDFNRWGGKEDDSKIDFERVKAIALNSVEMILHRWLPGGKTLCPRCPRLKVLQK